MSPCGWTHVTSGTVMGMGDIDHSGVACLIGISTLSVVCVGGYNGNCRMHMMRVLVEQIVRLRTKEVT